MADILQVFGIGTKGVNVDLNSIQLDDQQLTQAQNASPNPLGAEVGLSKQPGLVEINGSAGAGSILGGIGVPLTNLNTGTRYFYIGRGPKT